MYVILDSVWDYMLHKHKSQLFEIVAIMQLSQRKGYKKVTNPVLKVTICKK